MIGRSSRRLAVRTTCSNGRCRGGSRLRVGRSTVDLARREFGAEHEVTAAGGGPHARRRVEINQARASTRRALYLVGRRPVGGGGAPARVADRQRGGIGRVPRGARPARGARRGRAGGRLGALLLRGDPRSNTREIVTVSSCHPRSPRSPPSRVSSSFLGAAAAAGGILDAVKGGWSAAFFSSDSSNIPPGPCASSNISKVGWMRARSFSENRSKCSTPSMWSYSCWKTRASKPLSFFRFCLPSSSWYSTQIHDDRVTRPAHSSDLDERQPSSSVSVCSLNIRRCSDLPQSLQNLSWSGRSGGIVHKKPLVDADLCRR